jgi:hypothetical protein
VIITVSPLLIPAAIGPGLPRAITVAISVAIILVTLLTGIVIHRRGRVYILLADFQGSPVRLYQTSDKTEFGKLTRALTRAYTYHRYPRRKSLINSENDSRGETPGAALLRLEHLATRDR